MKGFLRHIYAASAGLMLLLCSSQTAYAQFAPSNYTSDFSAGHSFNVSSSYGGGVNGGPSYIAKAPAGFPAVHPSLTAEQLEGVKGTTVEVSAARKGVGISTDVLAVAMPVATLTYVLVTKDWTGLKQGAFTAATAVGATYILKFAVRKKRPDGSNNMSFPSFHTAACFADAAFIQRRYGWKFGGPAYALACYVGWGRTFAMKHDWWDVLAGAAIGAGSAYIYTRPFAKKHDLRISPATDGTNIGVVASMKF